MGKRERRKGADGEREVVALARASGLSAERTWSTAFSFDPAERCCDLLIGGRPFQVKRRGRAWKDLYDALANVDGVFVRADGRPWLLVTRADDFLKNTPVRPRGEGTANWSNDAD